MSSGSALRPSPICAPLGSPRAAWAPSRALGALVRAALAVASFGACIGTAAGAPQTPEQLFDEGTKAMAKRDFAAACPAFRRSFEASDSKGALYNLARCEDEGSAARLASSLRSWKEVRDRYSDQPDIVAEAGRRIETLEAKVARLLLRPAAGAPADMRVELDGQVAPMQVSIPVDAGKHTLAATAEGFASQRVDLLLKDGDARTVDLDPGKKLSVTTTVVPVGPAEAKPDAQPADEATSTGSPWTTAGFVAGGVGIAGLALFAISAPIIAGAESDLDAVCPSRTNCPAEAEDAAAGGEGWLVPNAIGFVAGVVGVGLGVTFLVIGSQDDGPTVGVRGDRLEVRGTF